MIIERLQDVCDRLISLNTPNNEKYLIIKKILNTKNAFINMSIEDAYAILRDLSVPEEDLKNVYMELIDPNNILLDN